MPEGENFDAPSLGVDLVQVIAGPAEKKAPNGRLLDVASSGTDSGLCRDELEGPLKVISDGKQRCWTILPPAGSPPRLAGSV
jgi:hypothetical protein